MCEKAWARADATLVSQVLVLEQHDVAGGCTHAFEEKGFEFDVGLHYVGGDIGNTKRQMGAMLSSLCSFPVEWADQGEIFDLAKFSWGEVPMRKGNSTLRVGRKIRVHNRWERVFGACAIHALLAILVQFC
jgi:hypothetical protein